jgi:hypothetical protein
LGLRWKIYGGKNGGRLRRFRSNLRYLQCELVTFAGYREEGWL